MKEHVSGVKYNNISVINRKIAAIFQGEDMMQTIWRSPSDLKPTTTRKRVGQ